MIISHRGLWYKEEEKNTSKAFERSFSLGFGTETDIRDHNGKLVIAHDIPKGNELSAEDFFQLYSSFNGGGLPLALNIKSDGLQHELTMLLNRYEVKNYFVFDMSVPDTLGYLKAGMKFYTRHSEYEEMPPLYEEAEGVWMDEFNNQWIQRHDINMHLNKGKNVCIVSPELHKRDHNEAWSKYAEDFNFNEHPNLHICTDLPETARAYFK